LKLTGVEVFMLGLLLSLLIDTLLGEPPLKLHPVVWVGRLTSRLKNVLNRGSRRRLKGVLLALTVIAVFMLPAVFFSVTLQSSLNPMLQALLLGLALKPTFALKSMKLHVKPVAIALENGDLEEAKRRVSLTVRRNTSRLSEGYVASAAVETVAEGLVDGFTSTLFLYTLLGLPGAVFHRLVSTLDSMVGYKDPEHIDIGWFSARLDTLINYVPARLTSLLMVVAAWLLRLNWRGAMEAVAVNRRKTTSLNAGWPISAMAGALNVKLEKVGYYTVNERRDLPKAAHIYEALRMMYVTATLFTLLIVLPLLLTVELFEAFLTVELIGLRWTWYG